MGADSRVCTLRGFATGSTLGAGDGVPVIFMVEYFYSGSVVTLGEMIIFASKAYLCFFAKCEQSDLSHFLFHHHIKRNDLSLGCLS